MRYHWLDDEVRELSNRSLVRWLSVGIELAVDGYRTLRLFFYPLLDLVVVRADKDEFVLSPALYQLIGFDDQFLGIQPFVFNRQLCQVGFWSDGDILVWDFILSVGVVFE